MGDRNIKKEGESIQREAQIRSFSTLNLSLRDGLKASVTQKSYKELEEGVVAGSDRSPPCLRPRGVKTKAKASGKAEIIVL